MDWLEEHGDALYAFARARLRDPSDAEDVVQDTFVAALDDYAFAEVHGEMRAWLIGVCRHKIVDHIRKQRRAHRPADEAREQVQVQAIQLGGGHGSAGLYTASGRWSPKPKRWDDPAAAAESQDFWRVYEACRAKLPPALAEAYVLRELEGLEASEVATTLGVSRNHLAVRLHRARLALRECLSVRWFNG